MWRQRAKSFGLVDVDKNSKYFTVGQPKGIDETESWVFRIQWGDGFIIRRILSSPSLSSIKTYLPSQIRPLEK